MRSWSAGACALGLLVGLGGTGFEPSSPRRSLAAAAPIHPAARPAGRSSPGPARRLPERAAGPRCRRSRRRRPSRAAAVPAAARRPRPTAPITPSGVTPGRPGADPSATMDGRTEPLRTNTDLSLPKSEREGGGGEPTEAAAAADSRPRTRSRRPRRPPEKDPTKLLMNSLGTRGQAGQGLRLAPEQLHLQRQRPRHHRPELRRHPEQPGQPVAGQPVLPDLRERRSSRATRSTSASGSTTSSATTGSSTTATGSPTPSPRPTTSTATTSPRSTARSTSRRS